MLLAFPSIMGITDIANVDLAGLCLVVVFHCGVLALRLGVSLHEA